VRRRMNQQDVFIRRRLRNNKIFRVSYAGFQQAIMYQPVLFRRKDMLSNRQKIFITVYELKRKHCSRSYRVARTLLSAEVYFLSYQIQGRSEERRVGKEC